MEKIRRKDVEKVIKATFPDYRGRKVYLQCERIPTRLDSYWDEGHRDYFCFLDLKTWKTYAMHSNHPLYERNQPREMSELPAGVLLVRRTYSGCNQYLTIFCNPCDMPKQIETTNPY